MPPRSIIIHSTVRPGWTPAHAGMPRTGFVWMPRTARTGRPRACFWYSTLAAGEGTTWRQLSVQKQITKARIHLMPGPAAKCQLACCDSALPRLTRGCRTPLSRVTLDPVPIGDCVAARRGRPAATMCTITPWRQRDRDASGLRANTPSRPSPSRDSVPRDKLRCDCAKGPRARFLRRARAAHVPHAIPSCMHAPRSCRRASQAWRRVRVTETSRRRRGSHATTPLSWARALHPLPLQATPLCRD